MNIEEFENRKILIFCPHQDDEINIAGGLLLKLKNIKCDVKVVYSTNGDYLIDGKYRMREAIKSLKVLGVPRENVIFLGYPDCYSENDSHLYMSNENWTSKNGKTETALSVGNEYHYIKHNEHAKLNRENFINDIKEVIEDEMADIIICIDYDEHCDHRALSLGFECAMGKVLKNIRNYAPIVLKAFAYPTAFFGVDDFKVHKIQKTKFNKNEISKYKFNNPYYDWNKRISIDVEKCVSNKFLIFNKLFKAMTKHVSQAIYYNAYSIINSDQVFFKRRTDNLLNNAKITVSSGNKKYLNDFMFFDSTDIMYGETKTQIIDSGYMKFEDDDENKKIKINFDKFQNVEEIKIYKYVNCITDIDNVLIKANGIENEYDLREEEYTYTLQNLSLKNVKEIEIIFKNYKGKDVSLTEIEIFSTNSCFEKNNIVESETAQVTIFEKIIFAIDDLTILCYRYIFKLLRLFYHK